jgi:hypothetical protein
MININTYTAADLMALPKYSAPQMVTRDIGFSRSGDDFSMYDLVNENETILSVSCSTPERLLAHLKGYVANRLAIAA